MRRLLSLATNSIKQPKLPFYYAAIFFSIYYLSLYASLTLNECHAWFYLYFVSPAARNARETKNTKMEKFLPTVGLEPATSKTV